MKNIPLFSIMTSQTLNSILDVNLIKLRIEKQKKKLAAFLEKLKSKTKNHIPISITPVKEVYLYSIHMNFYNLSINF